MDQDESMEDDELAYQQAKYPIELDFSDNDQGDLEAARKAIRREFIVIFDSVNAGSYGWAYDEWKRLVNVALNHWSTFVLAPR